MYLTHFHLRIRLQRAKLQDFWEEYSMDLEDDNFRRYYHMDKSTFRALTDYLNPKIRKYQGGRKQVLPHKMVGMTLCYLGCQMPYWQLSGFFGISEECFIHVTNYVMKLLKAKSSEIIKWPAKEDYQFVAAQFNKKRKRFSKEIIEKAFDLYSVYC